MQKPLWKSTLKRIFLVCLFVPMLVTPMSSGAQSAGDVLIYSVMVDGQDLWFAYDPVRGMSSIIPIGMQVGKVAGSVSPDGRLALRLWHETNSEIFVFPPEASDERLSITQAPHVEEFPLAWSRDGHFLAYWTRQSSGDLSLYVWDGETALNITSIDGTSSYDVEWSQDGRLAITVHFLPEQTSLGTNSEVYLWDGTAVVNVSQNPAQADYAARWSAGGQLAFLSLHDDGVHLLVWDGVSFEDGIPDKNTYTNVAPHLTNTFSDPSWTHDGRLAFQGRDAQIYVWDGQTVVNLSQNPGFNNCCAVWSVDGHWAFQSYYSTSLYVRDADNEPVLVIPDAYAPAWSADGYLAFCTYSEHNWGLNVWNGQTVFRLIEGYELSAQWQRSGNRAICTRG